MKKTMRFSIHQGMRWGGPNEGSVFKLLIGKSGARWLVNVDPRQAADKIYVEETDPHPGPFQGFGGATLSFLLEDGSKISLKGPWASNADSLFEDTGYDVRDLHLTRGIIGLKRESDYYKGDLYGEILHYDEEPTAGRYSRIEHLAQQFADRLGKTVYFSFVSPGGGTSSCCQPKVVKNP